MSDKAEKQYHFVVMAAQRLGIINPLAEAAGVSHKCLVEIEGKPLVEWTLSGIVDSGLARQITISIEDETALEKAGYVRGLMDSGLVRVVRSGENIFDSVAAALDNDDAFPAIITTADNVLFTPEIFGFFCKEAERFDACAGMASKETLYSKYPGGQERFHKFRDGEFTNCNIFGIMNPKALAAASVFRTGGQFLKAPQAKLIGAFGLFNAIAYKAAWFKRDAAFAKLGNKFGLDLGVVDMPFPESPIDVDNERTLAFATDILKTREAEPATA
ncbi:NTP transferase domain-containing protein [Hyphococcus flavus]|uniref:NTP transferase domain-containing protein n=1 Tax=Hyphococcus flavus TaxID=1866326 RepID=A0AAF0CG20_9PROT|nr:NTP transferase domain-containing protein [Hyphococcus flavus]WDI30222.1 NTP transferase domain-containing protein [Hyphococcus flavus]